MEIAYLTILTFFASTVGTMTGFGISTVMVPVVLLFLPLPETLLLVGVIHWFGDIWKMYFFKKGIDWKLLFYFGIPGVFMAYYGATLVLSLPTEILSRFVGGVLILYVLFLLIRPAFKLKQSLITAGLGGAGSGFLGGITGVGGGALRSVVLTAFNIPKSTYIFTSGLLGAVIDASRITTYFLGGTKISPNLAWGFLAFIPASLMGAWIAKRIVDNLPQKVFRSIIAVFLLVLGLKFVFLH
jgi:hypothetical protein